MKTKNIFVAAGAGILGYLFYRHNLPARDTAGVGDHVFVDTFDGLPAGWKPATPGLRVRILTVKGDVMTGIVDDPTLLPQGFPSPSVTFDRGAIVGYSK